MFAGKVAYRIALPLFFPAAFTALFFTSALLIKPARAELYFNINALHLNAEQKSQLDLSLLSHLTTQLPGRYRVHVSVNQRDSGEKDLHFVTCGEQLCPQLPVSLLAASGVKIAAIPALQRLPQEAVISDIAAYIPQAKADFNFDQRQLNLTIPQAALERQAQGYIPPERWEEGIPMLFSSYSLSGSEVKNRPGSGQESSQYLNLRNGINLGAWRLRNDSYYTRAAAGKGTWRSLQSWLERDIKTLRARLIVGDTGSPGLVFDSFRFRGAALTSQDEMLPFSMRGYAPVIHGVAMTHATVEVRQNGNLLYQTFVPPGDFFINDLYATGTSGDLEIIIREENGSVRKSIQAFATPPVSLRQGGLKYSLTAGEYGNRTGTEKGAANRRFSQLEAIYGLSNTTSIYGGAIAAQDYRAGTFGVGQSLGRLGALSLDITHATTRFQYGTRRRGESWRLRYNKQIACTGTALTLAGYRFDSDGYYSFDEASEYYDSPARALRHSLKNRTQLTLSQPVGQLGTVALSASQQTYRHQNRIKTRTIASSWSKNIDGITINLSQSLNKSGPSGKTDSVIAASFSLPLSKWLTPQSPHLLSMSNRVTYSPTAGSSLMTTLFGTALEGNNLSWSVSQARNQRGGKVDESSALFASLQSSTSTISLGYSHYYGQNQRITWAARGAVVAHPYGVTLAQPLVDGGSYALIRAPGAGKVGIVNYNGLKTDGRGYAVIPSLTAYQENEVSLDTSTLGNDVDLTDPVQKSVPTREALVLMDFKTRPGHRAFFKITRNGKPLPLGAVVSAGGTSGIVDERGQVYLTGLPEKVELKILLPGNTLCKIPFDSRGSKMHNGILMANLTCKG